MRSRTPCCTPISVVADDTALLPTTANKLKTCILSLLAPRRKSHIRLFRLMAQVILDFIYPDDSTLLTTDLKLYSKMLGTFFGDTKADIVLYSLMHAIQK